MSRKASARLVAVQCLGEVQDKQRALAEVTSTQQLKDPRERAFALRLTYGVLRWQIALEFLSAQLLDRPLKSSEKALQRLLLVGIYQLWQEDTADHAAVHATAETARALGKPWAVGLVNAVLRRFQRERESLLAMLENDPARFSHPQWMIDQFKADWPENWRAILHENNQRPPLWLRVNRLQLDPAAARTALEAAGFSLAQTDLAPDAVAISPAAPVQEIPGFTEGNFSVQDAAAQLAAELLDAEPGQHVLDACAAPGGKTCHLLELEPSLSLTALDLSKTRLTKVQENLDRLKLKANLVAADAAEPDQWWDGKPFDRILLDAPCTATGVIRRHPEIKCLRSPDQVGQVQKTQARLLRSLWPLLKPGGILVYATCSVLKSENQAQINAFLEDQKDAQCDGPDGFGHQDGPGAQILPGEQDMDGFYYARLRKTSA